MKSQLPVNTENLAKGPTSANGKVALLMAQDSRRSTELTGHWDKLKNWDARITQNGIPFTLTKAEALTSTPTFFDEIVEDLEKRTSPGQSNLLLIEGDSGEVILYRCSKSVADEGKKETTLLNLIHILDDWWKPEWGDKEYTKTSESISYKMKEKFDAEQEKIKKNLSIHTQRLNIFHYTE